MSLSSLVLPSCRPFPEPLPVLEEIVAATPLNRAASFAFALSRCGAGKPVMCIFTRSALRESGRPSVHGVAPCLPGSAPLMVVTRTAAEALWAMEQALKSGVLGGVLGAIEGATLTQSRRLDFAARDGATPGLILRDRSGGLSAARRRWRIAALPSAANPLDAQAPGAVRLLAELVRQRDGPPGEWILEHDAATGGLAVAAGLAADRSREGERRAA